MSTQIKISEQIIPKYYNIFNSDYKHIILTSGRAGTKSSFIGIEVAFQCLKKTSSAVVLRKRHNKLRKTVYKEVQRAFTRLGATKKMLKETKSPMEIKYLPNQSTVYFSGSDNIDDTKGIIDETSPISLVVLDELTEFFEHGEGKDELFNIEATFVRGNSQGFRMIYCYNPPKNPNAEINKWAIEMSKRSDTIHIHTDYRDVPTNWLGEDLIRTAEIMQETDEKMYRWVWLGQSVGIDEIIYAMFNADNEVEPVESYSEIIVGVDYGQQNATTFQSFGINYSDKQINGLLEYYHSGRETGKQKTPSDYADDFISFIKSNIEKFKPATIRVYIDPSARGFREELSRKAKQEGIGLMFENAKNKVDIGIQRTQASFSCNILTISKEQIKLKEELLLYEYDKKAIEKGQEIPVKQNDHCMDALRYAIMGSWGKIKRFFPIKIELAERGNDD